jgi:hypothetical protein
MFVHRDYDEKIAKRNWTGLLKLLLRNLCATSGNSGSEESVIEAFMRKLVDGLRGYLSMI